MNDKFDELAKGMAQSVTRRGALKKFGLGLAGIALACFGLASNAKAKPSRHHCLCKKPPYYGCDPNDLICNINCGSQCSS